MDYNKLLFERIEDKSDFIYKRGVLYKEIDSVVYIIDIEKSNFFENGIYITFGIFFRFFSPKTKIPVRYSKCNFEIRYGTLYNKIIKADNNMNLPIVIKESNINEIVDNILDKFIPYIIDYFSLTNLKNQFPRIDLDNVILAYINREEFKEYLNTI